MNKNFTKKYLSFAALLTLLIFFLAQDIFSQPAQFQKVINNVSHYVKAKNKSDKAAAGEVIWNGDKVTTGERSFASVFFTDDRSLLIIRDNSSVEIFGKKESSGYAKNTFVNKGELNFKITKRKDQDFIFTTPTAIASIRGTTGFIRTLNNLNTLIYIDTGLVTVNAQLGRKRSGSIGTGMFAMIDSSGDVNISQAPDSVKKEYNSTKSDGTRKIIIKTNHGDIIIEYLKDEDKH